ncbi:MAG: hypothetical protein J4224_05495 [Candidatus Diapherotrites archaeon]|uniref:Uncharacterized protein n=1 Tax=Candidatus Iainarchaeum sp. TaxID=3101447 RepID=A0A7J4ISU8_9ARCH|nr:MAG: hypothetical protein QT03_C0001G0535 [archaeon GW2011_AR10]MBS3059846.1 hypothetical protein [Candidatus Diapherotrites archaeon]HIH08598.1 hypothetical protein [Candidatus Diapherotrites archaeon]
MTTVKFDDLPENVKTKIIIILNHRKLLKKSGIIWGTLTGTLAAFSFAGAALTSEKILKYLMASAGSAGLATLALTPAGLRLHADQLRKDFAELYFAVKKSKSHPAIRKLSMHPYFVVDVKGNLVGKNSAPRLSRLFTIGRRRVPVPTNAKEKKFIEWKKTLPKRRKITKMPLPKRRK